MRGFGSRTLRSPKSLEQRGNLFRAQASFPRGAIGTCRPRRRNPAVGWGTRARTEDFGGGGNRPKSDWEGTGWSTRSNFSTPEAVSAGTDSRTRAQVSLRVEERIGAGSGWVPWTDPPSEPPGKAERTTLPCTPEPLMLRHC